jgi:hypothetical protein
MPSPFPRACFENGGGGRQGHRQMQSLLCVLPRRERQSVVPSGAPGHTGLRAHGTRREPAFGGGRLVAVYRHRDRFSWRGGARPGMRHWYGLCATTVTNRCSMRLTKARKCKPAATSGNRS